LVTDRGSTLLELTGIGPSGAARLLADVGDIHRFRDRDRFASWNGTAPWTRSVGADVLAPEVGSPVDENPHHLQAVLVVEQDDLYTVLREPVVTAVEGARLSHDHP